MHSAMNQVPDSTESAYHQTVPLGGNAIRIINGLGLISCTVCVFGLAWNLEAGKGWMSGAALPGLLLNLLVLVFNRFHKVRYALILLLWNFAFLPIFFGMGSYGMSAPGLLLIPVAILATCLLLSPRHGLAMALSCAALCALYYWLTQQGYLPTSEPLPVFKLLALQGTLGQVLVNLINNALKHAFDGRDKGLMQLSATSLPDQWLRIEFRDNGVGIAPQNLPRIFDPFFTTKMGQGGSGLGLSIVHNIITGMLGGRIEVQSRVGEGTCFRIDIPMVAQARQRVTALTAP